MLSLALAGKPNAGKSTFYTASTLAEVDVANYPFTTIDANRGVTHARTRCPCLDRDERCGNCEDGIRYVPVELVDVAGLVPGAHEGRGLGNQFLDELTNADAIVNVVDASGGTNAEGEPVEVGTFDPVEEVDFIEEELEQWLAGIVHRNWETVVRKSRSPDFDMDDALADLLTGVGASEYDIAAVLRDLEYPPNPREWTDEDRVTLARAIRQRTKPIVLVANKMDIAPEENLERLAETGKPVIAATADGELALRRAREAGIIDYHPGDDDFELRGDVSGAQQKGLERIRDLMAEHGGTGTQEAIDTAVYDVLDRITVYPVQNESKWTDGTGNVLPDAFLLPRASTPHDLAYAVHSDIGEGYLHAVDARSKRRIAEDHELSEGDVIKIVSTAN
ncbi:redox-regulated ATPase YchF [Haloferax mediterranei ATCC 33500]|uniref:Redox-regulated ATPase YchF n=1 Tax=Haloferax mediterranei (strain ATCC 33500 / DSM 1411 / JCM 8866 / NBRC 14739 / NCIMB 2177 / R-4) TaxID=523841 RepID=I3R563_HALMT|nr:redox-regulated ATPase YchF [Haloferax mediterranei]AFK19373.1 translation-associated GTPase [Haloferax mediterranei ATCC 33500]AHZ21276.1 translation-associated GTPase [Haloferax mediterranei ATCC 33500]EMA04437.1 translation-associated GTPase [Haloferax mediterranei ATCC 33500]MDX5989476.1 redox-regulated ATPase YchF [Haloferax mediterranei ATCC 33500]QCQ75837.1 redox-regulated ATPase YchF [Haloferax mediterranei ATCC 33500]